MLCLVPFSDKKPGDDPLCDYICRIAANTILEGMEFFFGVLADTGEIPDMDMFEDEYAFLCSEGFFRGVSEYFIPPSGSGRMKDDEVGREIIFRKLVRMREKLLDEKEAYTFDLLEEWVFGYMVEAAKSLYEDGVFYWDEEGEAKTEEILCSVYGLTSVCARKLSRQMYRLFEMGIEDEAWMEEFQVQEYDEAFWEQADIIGDLFFWDDDYNLFWPKGFIEGIKMIRSYTGKQAGYGYNYACEIFTDIGFKPPLWLLGSAEANRVLNEKQEEHYRESMKNMSNLLSDISIGDKDDHEEWEGDDLPFS